MSEDSEKVNGHEIPKAKLAQINVTDYMEKCLDKVAVAEGFKNYVIKVAHGASVGDGFVGLIFKVSIIEDSGDKTLNVILKTPPENQARRTQFGSMDLFRREIFVYNEYLPEVVKFQQENDVSNDQGFYEFPKVYYAEYNDELDDALIIMEDLKERGFTMWDKFTTTPYENAKLVMQALGKFHAISFAMKIRKPELFDKFKEMNDFLIEKSGDQMAPIFANYCDQAFGILEDHPKLKEKLTKMKEHILEIMQDITKGQLAEPYAVVTHGDCWSNNFMYKYHNGNPSNVCLIDYQISRYSSPVLDLVYFIFTCTSGELRKTYYDELLQIYHGSLKDLLDQLGGDTQAQFPFTALLRQLKKYGKFGAIMALFLIPMLTTKNEDLPDMDFFAENQEKMQKDPELMKAVMAELMKPSPNYISRMKPTLVDLMRFGYI